MAADQESCLQRRYPETKSVAADVEDSLAALGRFEIVFCYGLLYHLESPRAGAPQHGRGLR